MNDLEYLKVRMQTKRNYMDQLLATYDKDSSRWLELRIQIYNELIKEIENLEWLKEKPIDKGPV